MRGRELPDPIGPWIEAALRLIGVDPERAAAYWEDEGDGYRILVAAPIGLIRYQFGEIPHSFNQYEAVLVTVTPWSTVHPKVATTTRWDPVAKAHVHRLDLELAGHLLKDPASVRSAEPDTGLAAFAAECIRLAALEGRVAPVGEAKPPGD